HRPQSFVRRPYHPDGWKYGIGNIRRSHSSCCPCWYLRHPAIGYWLNSLHRSLPEIGCWYECCPACHCNVGIFPKYLHVGRNGHHGNRYSHQKKGPLEVQRMPSGLEFLASVTKMYCESCALLRSSSHRDPHLGKRD